MLYPAIFIVLCFIYMEPVSDSIIEPKDMMDVVVSVLSKPYISQYPQYFPYEKLLWVVALASALLGFNRVFSLYGFLAMIVIGTFQSMGDIEDWDYVWLVSNSVAIYIVGLYFLNEFAFPQNEFSWKNARKSRLWLLAFFPLLLWCPIKYQDKAFVWDFSLNTLLFGDSATAFCYVAPTLLAVMCIFYPHVDRPLFGVTTFVCSLFGAASMIAFGMRRMIPIIVMHIPLVVVSLYGYYLYFFANEPAIIKEKNE